MEPSMTSKTAAADPDAAAGALAARQRWLAVLAKAPLASLEAAWEALTDKPRYRTVRRGETGLVMVRGRIGGTGQPFNFGEMTMTRAAVQLLDAAGAVTQTGFGHVAGRSVRKAELVALFDALLQAPARHGEIADAVVKPLAAQQQAAKAAQAAKVAASRVDFFTMVRGE
jgi:alpha-D-ribose 1-methylphosphonate 5-triphosphate synthase subunit PhnG